MAMPKTDSKGRKLRFIRKGGKVIPIYSKDSMGQTRAMGIAATYGKKKGEFSQVSKNRGVFFAEGTRDRIRSAQQKGSSKGFKLGAAFGAASGTGLMIAAGGRRKFKTVGKKLKFFRKALGTKRGAIGIGAVVGSAALLGGMLGSGMGHSIGKTKQIRKEMKSGNAVVFQRRKLARGNTGV